ncbi:unnamed protein product [Polarella glacialis]|uniref:Uncharacterized protein n=1 Tax=Polarella glacialis TaxID=89957 RepID=A0A813GWW6_POLGL|nr:unnamed protein product [Polarella glacialis]
MGIQEFSAVGVGLVSFSELDSLLAQFLGSPGWRELETRTSRRLCDQYAFDGERTKPPPPHLRFCHTLVQNLLDYLQQQLNSGDFIVPLQCFLCLYEDGEDSCPSHAHDCRQLTMSFGGERTLEVEGRSLRMRHGDVVVLDGERHSLPAQRQKPTETRVSINLFFTTSLDLATRKVSVNHRADSGYRRQSEEGTGLGRTRPVSKGGNKGRDMPVVSRSGEWFEKVAEDASSSTGVDSTRMLSTQDQAPRHDETESAPKSKVGRWHRPRGGKAVCEDVQQK